uniref:ATP synthase complex subunit 8 n=1 Tax=Diaphanes mendax TaxID=370595 RepID=A0A5C0PX35_9COLE|nr:ATP synthase F0 subunit 8 [Diaphanes mendax]QEJ81633.1 ATP synthase F0 subunit 8 [Diaphanes mendax]
MPQMGPLNWLMLMIYFSIIFMMLNTFIYSVFAYNNKMSNNSKTFKLMWKW